MISFTLPLPPTINHYYGQSRSGKRFIKKPGITFRQIVQTIVTEAGHETLAGRLAMFVAIHPATRARQDLDNRCKALQDALTMTNRLTTCTWFGAK
jgi:crossover junction endodeoxyribonuclease RusA